MAKPQKPLDIDRELSRIRDRATTLASAAPTNLRKQIAHELRETAREIEAMATEGGK